MRILVLFAALLVFVVGILFIATPIPLGFPLFIVGTALVLLGVGWFTLTDRKYAKGG